MSGSGGDTVGRVGLTLAVLPWIAFVYLWIFPPG